MIMTWDGGSSSVIQFAPKAANPSAKEFFEATKDYSPRDRLILRRFLEAIRHILDRDGPDAALAVIDRAFSGQH